ncbi:jg8539 [Pararge aegeria aegeria]|uniref:diacylglycerol kinase (ATP) n=1 Tax=Pararge aegeria aegeria TaxID=348720 RepID=A0A8S4RJM3_9NEOP|nr:jg8539 [Pararge aegeria aegeria]
MDTITYINHSHFNYYFLIGGLFLGYLVYRIIHSLLGDNTFIQTKYRVRGHTWRSIDCNKSIPYNIYCTVCSKLMLPLVGLFCECCAVSACKRCHRMIDKKIRCKQISWPIEKTFHHLWVNVGTANKDNIDQNEDSELLMNKYFCSWCQRTKVSQENLLENTECDFQKYRNIIIPPTNVQVEKGKIVNIKPLPYDNWEPLIIFGKMSLKKCMAARIHRTDRRANKNRNADLASVSIIESWASVGILPMGTGNDLSRALGWGASCPDLDAHSVITTFMQADEQILDRWKITITPKHVRLGRLRGARSSRVLYAYNYASIGVDAQVALDFHRARSQFLYRYTSRYLNYIAYALLGVGRALDDGGCGGLEKRLRVQVGSRTIQLPPLQALIALNIPSWGAGVVGISSSIHIARLQCGLAEPFRFAQATRVWIDLDGCCAMQVDGEPWMQGPASIHIEPAGQSTLLRRSTQ